jgi:hypothetical protein
MAVTVKLTNGEERMYRNGDSAALQEPLFIVFRWNPKRRKLESVAVFQAAEVAWAEVADHGAVRERIVGRGRVVSN